MIQRTVAMLAAACGVLWFVADASAQFQNNNQQLGAGMATGAFGSPSPGLGNQQLGFGNQQLGFGNQQRGFGNQAGNVRGGVGARGGQQVRAGSAEAVQNSFENMGGRQQRRNNIERFLENLNELRDSQGQGGGQKRSSASVRVKIRPAFKVTPIEPAVLAAKLQYELEKSIELSEVATAAQVSVDGRVATLTGTVADEHEKLVLAKMLSLQPGVSRVENELVVPEKLVPVGSSNDSGLPTPPPVE